MSILDTTVVNVAIDHLAVAFHSSLTTIQWVITGYTLALAAVIPVTRLGGGPVRHQADLHVVARAVHARIGAVGPGVERGLADLLPRPAGHRRRDDHAGGHDDHDQEGRPSPDGPRHGRARRTDADRADPGPDPRRLARRQRVLAMDLLHQPADRDRRVHPRADRARARSAAAGPPARLARDAAALTGAGGVHLRPGRVLDLRVRLGALVGPDARRRRADRGVVHPQLAQSRTR